MLKNIKVNLQIINIFRNMNHIGHFVNLEHKSNIKTIYIFHFAVFYDY